jgi:proteasome lid subunit RPN8/RPN11
MFQAGFRGTIIRNEPAYRPRPVAMAGYHKFTSGNYDAFVKIAALEAIAGRARRAAPNEMIGHLLGRPFRDARGFYAVVTEAVVAESARCGPVTVETTLDDERELAGSLQADHPLAERLGWFHSHPFFMPYYSPTDLENQRFWGESYQLGLLACLERTGGVSIFAFRGPEAEEVQPPYMTSGRPDNYVMPFRPAAAIANREPAPKPEGRPTNRRPSRVLLTLAMVVLLPAVYLAGAWLMVQDIRTGRSGAGGTNPVISNPALPAKSDGQPARQNEPADVKHP